MCFWLFFVDFCWCISRELWTSRQFLLWSERWQFRFTYCSSESLVRSCWQAIYHCLCPDCYFYCASDLKDDINLFDYNVPERINTFVAAAVSQVRCMMLSCALCMQNSVIILISSSQDLDFNFKVQIKKYLYFYNPKRKRMITVFRCCFTIYLYLRQISSTDVFL